MGSRSRKRRRAAGEGPARPPAQRRAQIGNGAPAAAKPSAAKTAPAGAKPPAAKTAPAPKPAPTRGPAPIGARTRPAADPAAATPDPFRRGYARGRARDEAIRAELEPFEPGERPPILTLSAALSFAFAIANTAAALSGNDLASPSGDPTVLSIVTTTLLVVAAVGMLAKQYWAVLGFQTILGIQIVFFSLYLIRVQNLWQALITLVAIGLFGWLFWKLVRVMARLQMPEKRPG